MSTLHIFNPSHDEALASFLPHYTPTKAARRLAVEWAILPALWADPADCVWLPDDAAAVAAAPWARHVRTVTRRDMNPDFWSTIQRIAPWGWDPLLCQQLRRAGAPERLMPRQQQLEDVRLLSSRRTTAAVLPEIRRLLCADGLPTAGESFITETMDDVRRLLAAHPRMVAKSLWSCSGRGVFALSPNLSPSEEGRLLKLLREQGGVELEPYYNKEADFALEFNALQSGAVHFCGISLFSALPTGAYTGNLLAPQTELRRRLHLQWDGADFLPSLVTACETVLAQHIDRRYAGPLGVDMMLVRSGEGLVLHPCVEVNLRRTMGYVAVQLGENRQLRPEWKIPGQFVMA